MMAAAAVCPHASSHASCLCRNTGNGRSTALQSSTLGNMLGPTDCHAGLIRRPLALGTRLIVLLILAMVCTYPKIWYTLVLS